MASRSTSWATVLAHHPHDRPEMRKFLWTLYAEFVGRF